MASGGGRRNASRATLGDYLRDPVKAAYKDRRVAEAAVRRATAPPMKRKSSAGGKRRKK